MRKNIQKTIEDIRKYHRIMDFEILYSRIFDFIEINFTTEIDRLDRV